LQRVIRSCLVAGHPLLSCSGSSAPVAMSCSGSSTLCY
jgi:hypothetical protein